MITKYRTRLYARWGCEPNIERVEVERVTEFSVWIDGRRLAKTSEFQTYFDTWEQAQEALIGCQETNLRVLRNHVDQHEATLEEIQNMVNPEVAR